MSSASSTCCCTPRTARTQPLTSCLYPGPKLVLRQSQPTRYAAAHPHHWVGVNTSKGVRFLGTSSIEEHVRDAGCKLQHAQPFCCAQRKRKKDEKPTPVKAPPAAAAAEDADGGKKKKKKKKSMAEV